MELPHIIHDEILHKLEPAVDLQAMESLEAAYRVVEAIEKAEAVGEYSPLLRKKMKLEESMLGTAEFSSVDVKVDGKGTESVHVDKSLPVRNIVREEAIAIVNLAIPLMMIVSVELIPDQIMTMMIGHVDPENSAKALAAFPLAGIVQMLLGSGIINGLQSANDTLCTQAFGGKQFKELWLFCQAGLLIYVLCMPFLVGLLLTATPLLKAMGQDATISELAGNILAVYTLAVPFNIVCYVIKSGLQAQGIVYPMVWSSVVAGISSVIAGYFLAFHTSLGYLGIAFAFPVSFIVKTFTLLPILLKNEVFVATWPGWQLRQTWVLVKKISGLGVSSIFMVTFQSLGVGAVPLLAGLVPNAAVMMTANGIFLSMLSLSLVPLIGVSTAGAIRLGISLGSGLPRRPLITSHVIMVVTIVVSFVTMMSFRALADTYVHLCTTDTEAIHASLDLIYKLVPMVMTMGLLYGVQAIFKACGKQFISACLTFVCWVVLGIILGLLFATELHGGIAGLWYGNMAGIGLFFLCGVIWWRRLDWDALAHEVKMNTSTPAKCARFAEAA